MEHSGRWYEKKKSLQSQALSCGLLLCCFGCLSFPFFLLLHLTVVVARTYRPVVLSDLYPPCCCVHFPYVGHSAHDRVEAPAAIVVTVPSRMAPAPQKSKTCISFRFFFFFFLGLPVGKQVSDDHCMPPCTKLNLRHSTMWRQIFLVMIFSFFLQGERIVHRHKCDEHDRLHNPHKKAHSHPNGRYRDRKRTQEDDRKHFMSEHVAEES